MATLKYLALLLFGLAVPAFAATSTAQRFESPQGAVTALVEAVRSGQEDALRHILGPGSGPLLHSGDRAQDAAGRRAFLGAYDEAHSIATQDGTPGLAELRIGRDAWPLPIPLVQDSDARWHFNAAAGATEILARRIGQNELAAMQTCLELVEAERAYALDSLAAYPRHLFHQPRQGYVFKLLTAQGPAAPGGAYDYLERGQLRAGFAVLAYPARYGRSGIKSFIVNPQRDLFEKDLGPRTNALAHEMRVFNPDASWQALAASAAQESPQNAGSGP